MAKELSIKRCWFHAGKFPHYDIPLKRILEIKAKCEVVSTKQLLRMVKESEKVLEKKLAERVKAVGGWAIKLVPQFITGLPDRLCLFPGGKVAFAEIKTTGEKPRKIQNMVMKKLIRLGFDVRVIDRSEEIEKLIKDYAEN